MKFFQTLKKLFWISRPIPWPNTAYPFAVGYLITGGSIDLTFILGTLYFLGPYNLLMYGVNDVFDYESDIKNPRKGGIEGMKESRAFHPTIIKAAILTNAPFLLYLLIAGDWAARLTLAIVVFSVIAYSLKGLRFKEKPVLDSITSSLHFVGPLLFALALHDFPSNAWGFVIAFFIWGMASHAFGAVQDIVPDKKAGIASIATFFGAKRTIWIAYFMYLAAAIIVFLQGSSYVSVAIMAVIYCFNISPYLTVTEKTAATTNVAWKRFIWLNYLTGAIVTMVILITAL
ncbi:MAG: prenyltransferase [Patescibacteria group bacterium]